MVLRHTSQDSVGVLFELWEILTYRWVWVPTGVALIITAYWWLFVGALWFNAQTGIWIVVWFAVFAPLETVVIIAKILQFREKRSKKEKKEKKSWVPSKSAFDATVEANM